MKKFFLYLIIFNLAFLPIITYAQDSNSAPVGFIESMDNLQKLKAYRMNQYIKGDFEFSDNEKNEWEAAGGYNINFISDIVNNAAYRSDSQSLIKGSANVQLKGKDRPFNKVSVDFRLEMKKISDSLYIKLDSLAFNADGVPKKDTSDYQQFQAELNDGVSKLKNQWIYFPYQQIEKNSDSGYKAELGSFFNSKKLEAELKKNGINGVIKEAVSESVDSAVKNKSMTKAEALQVKMLVSGFLEKGLFTQSDSTDKSCSECQSYALNKKGIIEFISKLSGFSGTQLADDDIQGIKSFLDNVDFSASIKENPESRILDMIKVKFGVKNMGPLNGLSLEYFSKIGKIKIVKPVKAPENFKSIDELQSAFSPDSF